MYKIKSGEKIDVETKKLIVKDMLKEVIDFCDKNDINYFISCGTLIGAVRHKGFIPWDDDVDLIMLREDYNRFLKIFKSKNIRLLTSDNNEDYYYCFAKLVDKRTYLDEFNLRECKDMGIFLDIFPVDYVSDNKFIQKLIITKMAIYNIISFYYRIKKETLIKRNNYGLKNKILYGLFHNNKRLNKIINRKIDRIGSKKSNILGTLTDTNSKGKLLLKREWFDDYTYVEFEGIKCKAPIGYDEYLRFIYGDYMKLPPKEKQVSVHMDDSYWR